MLRRLKRYPFLLVDLMPPGSELIAPLCARAWSMKGPLLPAPLQCALLTPPHPALAVAFLLQTQSSVAKTSQGTMETRSLKTLLVKEKKKNQNKRPAVNQELSLLCFLFNNRAINQALPHPLPTNSDKRQATRRPHQRAQVLCDLETSCSLTWPCLAPGRRARAAEAAPGPRSLEDDNCV